MPKLPYINWKARRGEALALVHAKASLADVARHFGCSDSTASAGLRRIGLCIDPESVNERRRAKLAAIGSNPVFVAKRSAKLKALRSQPHERERAAAVARARWQDPKARARMIEGLKRARREMPLEVKQRAAAARLAWCPPEWRAEYRRQRDRVKSAAKAKVIILAKIEGGARPPARPLNFSAPVIRSAILEDQNGTRPVRPGTMPPPPGYHLFKHKLGPVATLDQGR